MPSDATTFFLAFATVFGGLAYGLWRLERGVGRLEARLDALSAGRDTSEPGRERGGSP